MALPILEIPKYELTLLSGKTIHYRPFLVKEQKVLLTALQTGNRKDALRAMSEIAKVCTFGEAVVDELPNYEVERLFLNIRAKSVGEELPVNVKCDFCEEPNPYDVKLLEDMVVANADAKAEPVMLTDTYGLLFHFPTMADTMAVSSLPTDDQLSFYFELAKRCLVGVVDGKDFYTSSDSTPTEVNVLFDRLDPTQMEKVQAFFDSMPMLSYRLKFNCKKCMHDNDILIEGTDSFFG